MMPLHWDQSHSHVFTMSKLAFYSILFYSEQQVFFIVFKCILDQELIPLAFAQTSFFCLCIHGVAQTVHFTKPSL